MGLGYIPSPYKKYQQSSYEGLWAEGISLPHFFEITIYKCRIKENAYPRKIENNNDDRIIKKKNIWTCCSLCVFNAL